MSNARNRRTVRCMKALTRARGAMGHHPPIGSHRRRDTSSPHTMIVCHQGRM